MKLMALILRVFSNVSWFYFICSYLIFETILIKKKNPIAVKRLIEHRTVFSENFFFIALDTSLAQFFS